MPPQIESEESGSGKDDVNTPREENDADEDSFATPDPPVENGAILRKSEQQGEDEQRNSGGEDEEVGNAQAEDEEEDEDEDEDEEEEEVYIVERIVKHAVAENDAIIYQVKWKGYPSSENTWETEDNLDGAKDILREYFNKIGGRPVDETNPKDTQKKRGRKSTSAGASASKRSKVENIPVRPGRGRKSGKSEERKVEKEEEIKWPGTIDINWAPPKPRKDNWEDILLKIEALEVDDDNTKWAFVIWSIEDSKGAKRTSKVLLDSVSIAAPQATIKFYESHLVFTKN